MQTLKSNAKKVFLPPTRWRERKFIQARECIDFSDKECVSELCFNRAFGNTYALGKLHIKLNMINEAKFYVSVDVKKEARHQYV